MSDIISAIYDDINEYLHLCKKYDEKPVYGTYEADCYGKHAEELKKRARKDWEMKNKGIIVPLSEQKIVPDL